MNMPMCSRCKKNIAVVFITKIEGPDKTTQEGLCLKCARELGVKPLDNIMEQMGITEDDLEALSGEIGSLSDLNDLVRTRSFRSDREPISPESASRSSSVIPICSMMLSSGLTPSSRAHLRHRPSWVVLSGPSILVMNTTAMFFLHREHIGIFIG